MFFFSNTRLMVRMSWCLWIVGNSKEKLQMQIENSRVLLTYVNFWLTQSVCKWGFCCFLPFWYWLIISQWQELILLTTALPGGTGFTYLLTWTSCSRIQTKKKKSQVWVIVTKDVYSVFVHKNRLLLPHYKKNKLTTKYNVHILNAPVTTVIEMYCK